MKRALCILFGILLPLGWGLSPASAQVEARIIRVGLFAGTPHIVRSGCWSFVEVDIRWRGDKPFDGELHVDQFDRDGDLVTFIQKVALTPDGEWHRREVYFVPHDVGNSSSPTVKLYDQQGRLMPMLDERGQPIPGGLAAPSVTEQPLPDDFLILDLSPRDRLPHMIWLDSDKMGKSNWINARKVRPLSPTELPRQGRGLECVDAIVWDNADSSVLAQQQIEALASWVEDGGRLLLTAGSNWQSLTKSPLAEILPVKIVDAAEVTEAQEFLDLVRDEEYEVRLARQYSKQPLLRCQMRPLPTALPIPADSALPQIAYRRYLGRGEVVFVGASLNDLLPKPSQMTAANLSDSPVDSKTTMNDPFILATENVIGRRLLTLATVREPQTTGWVNFEPRDLYSDVRRSIGFESQTAAFVVFAILFAIAYTLVATVGSYWYLNRRSRRHWCWMAFAIISIIGSVLGTGLVWTLRGVRTQVIQTTIVDAQAGIDRGHASCLFGVKTPSHVRLTLRLPQDQGADVREAQYGSLRAMPEFINTTMGDSTFVAAEAYASLLGGEELSSVPFRATLKEIQGQWRGSLGGTLDARLVSSRSSDPKITYEEFGEGSYIRNNLGVTLHDCYLLETRDEVALNAARVGCFYMGDLPKTGPGASLTGTQIRDRLYFEAPSGRDATAEPKRIERYPYLDPMLEKWRDRGANLASNQGDGRYARVAGDNSEYYPLLLLSVYDLLNTDAQKRQGLHRGYGRPLDGTRWLTSRTALLIGWSEDPPPAQLQIGPDVYRPTKSGTMYRVVIPVERPRKS